MGPAAFNQALRAVSSAIDKATPSLEALYKAIPACKPAALIKVRQRSRRITTKQSPLLT